MIFYYYSNKNDCFLFDGHRHNIDEIRTKNND